MSNAARTTPLIAVTGRRRPAGGVHTGPAQLDVLDVDFYFTGYANHVQDAGGIALHLPTDPSVRPALGRLDGLVLTGGVDIDPQMYGRTAGPTTQPVDRRRDATELGLLEEALELGIPLLAICRGLQLVNVFLGGTLHDDLPDHRVGDDHEILIEPASLLGRLYGPTTTVNSLHHQSVDRVGEGLVVSARALDGVVEAVEHPGRDLLGVQWHPEQLTGPQPAFGWLAEAAGERAAVR
ncbi:gamma-glutamyl-gamma-aminobutyrate hydrolase family protein [Pseudonocardia sp. ICBG1034]|uniref:gamma-glutamyl-gamma-aminobutyrate hydrolase family protein n=1 Tax=Pseudonocardia sp. ICBG1034 TaxID=2844381 RepID=UPI001CCC0823|nr:gamma-glutamyl-gamma-aminobutyrate hydrolase family protein [Pseudonocardia sp. ICBG1034]